MRRPKGPAAEMEGLRLSEPARLAAMIRCSEDRTRSHRRHNQGGAVRLAPCRTTKTSKSAPKSRNCRTMFQCSISSVSSPKSQPCGALVGSGETVGGGRPKGLEERVAWVQHIFSRVARVSKDRMSSCNNGRRLARTLEKLEPQVRVRQAAGNNGRPRLLRACLVSFLQKAQCHSC